MIDKPKVGDVVFLRFNDASKEVSESVVESVGRKYFAVKSIGWHPHEFNVETRHKGYWTSSSRSKSRRICYRSESDFSAKLADDTQKKEAMELGAQLEKAFNWWNRDKYTLDQLRRIKSIINEGKATQ